MLTEGIRDPGIFKAVFLAGGPGSGKSFVVGQTALTSFGLKIVNPDRMYEYALAKHGMAPTPDNIKSEKGQLIRARAKSATERLMDSYINGRLGLVIDGTGKDYSKIQTMKAHLQHLGYDCAMIFVNTDKNTALARNKARTRTLPTGMVSKMWSDVQNNIGKFQNLFGQHFIIVDNSENSNIQGGVMSAYRTIGAWVRRPPNNHHAREWINSQMKKRNIREKLDADKNSIGDYISDFKKSDAPQFKGKGKFKRRSMAVAAYLASKRKKESLGEINRHGVPKDATKTELKKIRSNPNSSPGAKKLAHWKLNMHHNEGKEHSWKTDGHYTQDGKEWKGLQHAHDGQVMTGEKHTEKSVNLFHFKDLKPNIRQKILDKLKEDAEYDPTPGGMEWGTDQGTEYFKKLTPGEQKAKKTEMIKPIDTPIEIKENEEVKIDVQKDNSKHEYKQENEEMADYFLTQEDIADLENEAENITYDQLEYYSEFDDFSVDLDLDDEEFEPEEWDEELDEELSTQGRLKRRFAARRNRQKLKVARQIALRRGSSPDRLKRRAVRGARGMVYKRLLRGRDKKLMPPAEKARFEKLVARFAPLVQRLSVKMLPNMRKMEIARMKGRNKKKASKSKTYKPAKPIAKKQKSTKFKIKK